MVIESDDENVEITIRPLTHESHKGNDSKAIQYRIGDTTTGSSVTRLRSGAYIVDLKGRENEYELSQDRFILKRGGKVVVTVTRRDDISAVAAARPSVAVHRRSVSPLRVLPHEGSVASVAYLSDGTIVSATTGDKTNPAKVFFWGDSAETNPHWIAAPQSGMSHMVTSIDGKWLATGSRADHKVVLWDATARQHVKQFDAGGMVHSVAISPDSKLLAAASWDGSAKVWSIESHDLVKEIGGYFRVHRVAFSPDGKTLAVSETPSGRTDLFDTNTWMERASCVHGYGVGQMAFSPDGKLLVTGGAGLRGSEPYKMSIKVWDLAPGKLATQFNEMQNAVEGVAISPDSRYLIASSSSR